MDPPVKGRRGDQRGEGGFTLLEVLVSIAIIAIGLITLAGMQTRAVTGNREAGDMTVAIQLAEEMAERIRVNGRSDPALYNGLDTSSCAGLPAPASDDCARWKSRLEDSNLDLRDAVGTVTVTDDSPISNTATVRVTVTWGGVVTRSVTFTTILETWRS